MQLIIIYLQGRLLGIRDVFLPTVARVVVDLSTACDPAVAKNAQRVFDELAREESAFSATLERGQKLLGEVLAKAEGGNRLGLDLGSGLGLGLG